MKENSRQLRVLRPPNEGHNSAPINYEPSALCDTTHMLLNILSTLTRKSEDAQGKVKREQSKRISGIVRTEITNEAIHGIFKIIYSSLFTIKLFWTLSLVVSMGLFSFLVMFKHSAIFRAPFSANVFCIFCPTFVSNTSFFQSVLYSSFL